MVAIHNNSLVDMSPFDMSTPFDLPAQFNNSAMDFSALFDITSDMGMSASVDMNGSLNMSVPMVNTAINMIQPAMVPSNVNGHHQAMMQAYSADNLDTVQAVAHPNSVNDNLVYYNDEITNVADLDVSHNELASPGTIEHRANGSGPRIPRPRNSFILYRQWMSKKLRTENPELTAGSISQIVGSLWRRESRRMKAHFNLLARMEDERHRAKYPNYRYEARRVLDAQPAHVFNEDGMHIGEHLIHLGH
ncbi:HMG (high mobility group) box domain containing protein [Naviculisporaceae sp. PSN 640]